MAGPGGEDPSYAKVRVRELEPDYKGEERVSPISTLYPLLLSYLFYSFSYLWSRCGVALVNLGPFVL